MEHIGQAAACGAEGFRCQFDALAQAVVFLLLDAAGGDRGVGGRHFDGAQIIDQVVDLARLPGVAGGAGFLAGRGRVDRQLAGQQGHVGVGGEGGRAVAALDAGAGRDQQVGGQRRREGEAQGGLRRLRRQAGDAHQLAQVVQHRGAGVGDQVLLGRLLDADAHQGLAVGDHVDQQALDLRRVKGLAGQLLILRDDLGRDGLRVAVDETRLGQAHRRTSVSRLTPSASFHCTRRVI